jgi:hypothetical protein
VVCRHPRKATHFPPAPPFRENPTSRKPAGTPPTGRGTRPGGRSARRGRDASATHPSGSTRPGPASRRCMSDSTPVPRIMPSGRIGRSADPTGRTGPPPTAEDSDPGTPISMASRLAVRPNPGIRPRSPRRPSPGNPARRRRSGAFLVYIIDNGPRRDVAAASPIPRRRGPARCRRSPIDVANSPNEPRIAPALPPTFAMLIQAI